MKWIDQFRGEKKERILILLLAGILLLVIAIPTEPASPERNQSPQTEAPDAPASESTVCEALEQRLCRILGRVEGIGKTDVMITLKSDGQRIVEKDTSRQEAKEQKTENNAANGQTNSSSDETTVYQKDASGNEQPYVRETLAPEIAGVLVIAQGGGNAVVVNEITEAVMALFGVEAHKIKVMKME